MIKINKNFSCQPHEKSFIAKYKIANSNHNILIIKFLKIYKKKKIISHFSLRTHTEVEKSIVRASCQQHPPNRKQQTLREENVRLCGSESKKHKLPGLPAIHKLSIKLFIIKIPKKKNIKILTCSCPEGSRLGFQFSFCDDDGWTVVQSGAIIRLVFSIQV